jgi:transposase
VQVGHDRRRAGLACGKARLRRLAVDIGLDGEQRLHALDGLARQRAAIGQQFIVEVAPRMRPARRLDHAAALVERVEPGVGVGLLWWDGQGLVLLAKRLEKGRFLWPTIAREGVVTLTTAQLAMLLEGLDWRTPTPSWKPEIAV